MDVLEVTTQLLEISDISKVFGLDIENLLTFVLGSFIVGYICLTFYYKIYYNNELWTNLEFTEKAVVSLIIGFFSIFTSLYLVTIYQLLFLDKKELEQTFLQLKYVSPFLYFIYISVLTSKSNYKGLDFIKRYILISFTLIAIMVFLSVLVILCFNKDWKSTIWMILLILIILGPYIIRGR